MDDDDDDEDEDDEDEDEDDEDKNVAAACGRFSKTTSVSQLRMPPLKSPVSASSRTCEAAAPAVMCQRWWISVFKSRAGEESRVPGIESTRLAGERISGLWPPTIKFELTVACDCAVHV
jgi:hypothetical protein